MFLTSLTIRELRGLLLKKEVTSREITDAYLSRISALDPRINAYVTVTHDEAVKKAVECDAAIARGAQSPLLGIPISIKDIFTTAGTRTTCSSLMLKDFIPSYDATVVRRLKQAGAVMLGKTNMDEFAMGSSTENSAFMKTKNPWAIDRVPGGSSGGSAAAVAAGLCAASVGTDTGGSIRQPASLCGVVGLKPTYGRVSRYGMIAFASSLDQAGPIAKDAEDAAIMLGVISGKDSLDSTSEAMPVPDYASLIKGGIRGIRIGIPDEYFVQGMDKEVETLINNAIGVLRGLGAEPVRITLPHTEYAVSVYYLVATAEASSNLARYDGVRYGHRSEKGRNLMEMYKHTRDEGFGAEVKRRIMLGTYSLSAGYYDAYYKKASQVRTLIKNDFEAAFAKCDIIITPTSPTPAFKFGEKVLDPLTMYLSDIFTISCNLAGIPGASVPCGFTDKGLPVGLQILGREFDEATILKAAYAYEQATQLTKKRPAL
ncbi:MAG: Asp-tRNA(Asn)/Glu-tRNA(Gln) amidotransferase subunit GatA [Deltaproteobacteria bacterium]